MQDPPHWPRPACGRLTSVTLPTTGMGATSAAPNSRVRPSHAVPPASVAEPSFQKIIFDLQLANLPIQKIDLSLIDASLRPSATLEDARRTLQQMLLPVVNLVEIDPEPPPPPRRRSCRPSS